MTAIMAAYRIVEWQHPPEMVEIEVPRPGPGEVLVKVAGNGLCHSDITMMEIPGEIGEHLGWQMPFTLGHEASGHIAEVGPGTELPAGMSLGDGIALMSAHSCGTCRYCVAGEDSLCTDGVSGRGYGRDGGLAEYVLARANRDLVPIGNLDPVIAGTLTDAAATSYHAVSRVLPRLVEGSTVAVFGIGGLGSYVVQLIAALSPATIIAVDVDESRRQRATELGAHHVIEGVQKGTASELRRVVGSDGCDAVIDIVGTDATIACGMRSLRPGGAYALVGAAGGTLAQPWYSTLPREAEIFTFQGSRIEHVHAVVALAAEGRLRVDAQRSPFERVADAYERLRDGTLSARAVIEMP